LSNLPRYPQGGSRKTFAAPLIKPEHQKTPQIGTSRILFLEMGCIFLFYNVTIAIAMTNIHPFTTAAACLLTAGAALFTSSCQPTSPESYARQFATAQNVSVHGYNGRETLSSRVYADWGGMPANARRAMEEYIKGAEWKTIDYIRPQYFIQVDRSFWAICIDNVGNMVGILPFRNGQDARKMSVNNHFDMLVNTTDRAPALGYAILKNLAYADGLRVSTRKADGLETPVPTPPSVKVVVPPKGTAPGAAPAGKPAAAPAAAPGAEEDTPSEDASGTEETPDEDNAAGGEDATATDDAAATDDF